MSTINRATVDQSVCLNVFTFYLAAYKRAFALSTNPKVDTPEEIDKLLTEKCKVDVQPGMTVVSLCCWFQ